MAPRGVALFLLSLLLLLLFLDSPVSSQATDASNQGTTHAQLCKRSEIEIIWSCLAVILACTWVSVHPNVPGDEETPFSVVLRKISIMVDALLAPELVLFWAMRQWHGSRVLAERYKDQGWTKTHGFFLLMGGFVLEDPGGNGKLSLLHHLRFHELLVEGQIDFPKLLPEDLEDHSKADWLAKLVVILQVTWFIVQCIARGAGPDSGLTELEVVTLAFATLNAAMYFFWWNKPLDVKRSIRIPLKPQVDFKCGNESCKLQGKDQVVVTQEVQETAFEPLPNVEHAMNVLDIWAVVEKINKRPFISFFSKPITSLIWCQDPDMTLPEATRAPTFYAPTLPDPMVGTLFMMAISVAGVCFGAVHFIGWNIETPTTVEQYTWRISTVAITTTFFVNIFNTSILVYKLLRRRGRRLDDNSTTPLAIRVLEILLGGFELLTVPFYIIGRVCLFGLAFATLRSLPPAALKKIEWTSYLPHI